MEKKVIVEDKPIRLKASAGTVRRYRDAFNADLIEDMLVLEGEIVTSAKISIESKKITEQVAWTMAKECDPNTEDFEEWLEQFSPFFSYLIVPHVITVWRENLATLNKTKKS